MARPLPALAWLLGALLSSALCLRSLWPLPRPPRVAPPPPLPRPPSAEERAAVEAQGRELEAELVEASRRLGRPVRAAEAEGMGPEGRPLLPSGLPDNPLLPGVAQLVEACGPVEEVDWMWCGESGKLRAGGLMEPAAPSPPQPPRGKE